MYANLARCARDRMIVIAPRLSYSDGLPIIGWREHDRGKPYRVIRLPLLRTNMINQPLNRLGKMLFLAKDSIIRFRVAAVLLWLIVTQTVRTVCIGELLASSWIIRLFRFMPGVKIVAYIHGEEITTQDPYDRNHHRGRRALLGSDRVIVVSRFTQDVVSHLLGATAGNCISLIENGVDSDRFNVQPKSKDLLELYHLKGCFVFVSVCRLLEKKGIDQAIRAFAQVVRQQSVSRFLVVGAGPYGQTLQELARSLGLADQVIFAGQVADNELADYYRLGDIFLMPNRALANGDTEGFGLVFLEANGCGLPVIAGCDGGSKDAVQHGVNGLVVDGRSVEEIATAMIRLREDTALRDTLRHQGLAVAARAGWTEKTQTFLQLCLGT